MNINLSLNSKNLFVYIVALSSHFSYSAVGVILISELLLFVLLLYLIFTRRVFGLLYKVRRLVLLVLILSISVLLADLINNSDFANLLKGQALVWSFLLQFLSFLWLFSSRENSISFYFFGLVTGLIITASVESGFGFINSIGTNFFKVYAAPILFFTVLGFGFVIRPNHCTRSYVTILVGLALFMFAAGARSDSLVLFSGLLIFFLFRKREYNLYKVLAFGSLFYLCYATMIYSYFIFGLGGENMSQLELLDNPWNPLSLLQVGRLDVVILWEFFLQSPFVGHGTWASNESNLYLDYREAIYGLGVDSDFIRAHSIFFGFLAYSGILAGISVSVIYLFFCVAYKKCLLLFSTHTAGIVVSVIFVYAVWNFFFSPLGHFRTTAPFCFAIIFSVFLQIKNYQFRLNNHIH